MHKNFRKFQKIPKKIKIDRFFKFFFSKFVPFQKKHRKNTYLWLMILFKKTKI